MIRCPVCGHEYEGLDVDAGEDGEVLVLSPEGKPAIVCIECDQILMVEPGPTLRKLTQEEFEQIFTQPLRGKNDAWTDPI